MQEKEKICCFSWQVHSWEDGEWKKEFSELLRCVMERAILGGVTLFCVDIKSANDDFISILNALKEKYSYVSFAVTDRKAFRAFLKNANALIAVWDCTERGRTHINIRFAEKHDVQIYCLALPIKSK